MFAEWQPKYAERGIVTFPVRPDSKTPAVKNFLKAGPHASAAWASRPKFRDYLIGLCPGRRNRITVLDVDVADDRVMQEALQRHGDTPVIVGTASGKFHAWYRYDGEPRAIRPWDGLPIDVLGDRNGIRNGQVIVPHSRRPDRTEYKFLRGGLDDLDKLPRMWGVADLKYCASPSILPDDIITERGIVGRVKEGRRDIVLWQACMAQASNARSLDELEPISKSFEENDEAGKLDKAEEIAGVVLPANEDPALPLNPGEETLDEPASHVAA